MAILIVTLIGMFSISFNKNIKAKDFIEENFIAKNICFPSSTEEFPDDIFKNSEYPKITSIVHITVALYIFWAIAVLCENYFVPILENLAIFLQIEDDVAGATLMAIGGSMPELFIAMIGVFVTKGDIGTGTILGSSVLNILLVVGTCGLVAAKGEITLNSWPITRDSIFYLISLILAFIILFDGVIYWYYKILSRFETLILLLCYLMYLILLSQDKCLRKFLNFDSSEATTSNSNAPNYDKISPTDNHNKTIVLCGKFGKDLSEILLFPINTLFSATIPIGEKISMNRETGSSNKAIICMFSFIASIFWIGILTYVLIWMIVIVGNNLGIPDSIMGITLIAFGSSVPDTYSSLIVMKRGLGNMAICHSIGSNIFDLLVGLGFPWFLALIYRSKLHFVSTDSYVQIYSLSLLYSCIISIFSIIVLWFMLYLKNWRLTKINSILLVIFYTAFIISSIILELTFFSKYYQNCGQ